VLPAEKGKKGVEKTQLYASIKKKKSPRKKGGGGNNLVNREKEKVPCGD